MKIHYKKTEHGIYEIVPLHDSHYHFVHNNPFGEPKWEIFAPEGRNFDNCHSYLEDSYRDCLDHVGGAVALCAEPSGDSCCGCQNCRCNGCKEYYEGNKSE